MLMSTSLGCFSHWSRRRSRTSRGAEMMSKNKIEEKEEVGMEFLNVEDFKGRNFDGLSRLDILVEVCDVASRKFEQEKLIKEAKNKIMINNNNNNNKATEKSPANSAPHDCAAADHDEFEAHNGFERKYDDGVDDLEKKKMIMFTKKAREEELMSIKDHMHGPSSTSKGGAANSNSAPADFVKLGMCFCVAAHHHHEAYPVLRYKQQIKYHQIGMEPTRPSSSSSEQKSTKFNSAATTDGHGEAHTRSSASINGLKLKRKLDYDHDHKDGAPKKQIKNKTKNLPRRNRTMINLNLPTTLPKEHMDKIRSLGGIRLETLEMVFDKKLYNSDILKSQNRLTMPPAQISSENFLKAKEIADLKRNDTLTELTLIDPRLEIKKVSLGRWNLSDKKYNYVLKSTWSEIVQENKLVEHDVIQVWWFRNDKEKIHLALVIVERAERKKKESNGAKEADETTEKDHDSANGGGECGGFKDQQQQHWMVAN